MKIGFDSEKYLKEQSAAILERAAKFDGKLYLEFGGKLICDFHAARVLPGFDPDAKIKLLQRLKDKVDIIIKNPFVAADFIKNIFYIGHKVSSFFLSIFPF